MQFLRGIGVICFKECKDSFNSPFIYIITAIFNGLVGFLFYNYLAAAKTITTNYITANVVLPMFGVMSFLFLFIGPLLTMGHFTEERKAGTLDLLFLSNLTDMQVILGKLLSSALIALFMIAFTFICPVILSFSGYSDWGMVFSNYLGLFFTILSTLALGQFCSSFGKNQIISVFISFTLLLFIFLLTMSASISNDAIVAQILRYFSISFHAGMFAKGGWRSFSFMYFFSFVGLFLYMTKTSLMARKW
jgi:ABC-2 type transport system permease protein